MTVQIDFDGLQQRILSVPGVPERQYSQLQAGVAGTVYLPRSRRRRRRRTRRRGGGGGNDLQRYRLSDRRAATFVTGVADYDVSADGRKLLYRTRRRRRRRGGRGGAARRPPAPALFLVDADRNPPQAGQGRLNVTLRMYLEPKEEFKQIFNEGWRNQRDYLYVPNMHGADWPKMKEMYGAAAAVRESPRRSQLPARQHGRRDRDRPLVRARRRHAGRAAHRSAACSAPTSRSRTAATRSRASTTTRAGTRICARRSPRRASTSTVGDYILAINGIELKAPDNIYRLLDGTANRQTVLTVNSRPAMRRRAAGHGRAGRERAGAAHARVGRVEPPARRQAVERPARLRLPAEHRAARLHELQPLLLRAAGQEGRGHRRALQRRRLGGRLHHRRAAARLRRLLQQRRRRSHAVHQSRRPASGDRR